MRKANNYGNQHQKHIYLHFCSIVPVNPALQPKQEAFHPINKALLACFIANSYVDFMSETCRRSAILESLAARFRRFGGLFQGASAAASPLCRWSGSTASSDFRHRCGRV